MSVCAALHSAPTIDLLIIAAFYSQFFPFFSIASHPSICGVARAKDQHFETHGHINMDCMCVQTVHCVQCIHCFRYFVDFLQSNTFKIFGFFLLSVDIVSLFIYTLRERAKH